jgi:hypothetical protein
MSGEDPLIAMIAKLRAFGKTALEDVAKEAAPLVEAALKETAAAGTTPNGEQWKPRKDGSRAMPDAADSISATAQGKRVVVKTSRGHAINNNLREGRRRQVIPSRKEATPKIVVDALEEGARRAFEKVMRR